MEHNIVKYLAAIGAKGGRKSRRQLDSQTARQMVRVREAKRAYKRFYAQCFWSYDPQFEITSDRVEWVAERLMKHGNRDAWAIGAKLCR